MRYKVRKMKLIAFVLFLILTLSACLPSFGEVFYSAKLSPAVSIKFSEPTVNFQPIEVIRLEIHAHENSKIRHAIDGSYKAEQEIKEGEELELLIVTELTPSLTNKEIVTTLYDSEGGKLAVMPLGKTDQSEARSVKQFISGVPNDGVYTLSSRESRFDFGSVLGLNRFIELLDIN